MLEHWFLIKLDAVHAVCIETCTTKITGLFLLGSSESCSVNRRSCSFSISSGGMFLLVCRNWAFH